MLLRFKDIFCVLLFRFVGCLPSAAYCVYEVYSWDVMEPFTYFLMVRTDGGALIGVAFLFS